MSCSDCISHSRSLADFQERIGENEGKELVPGRLSMSGSIELTLRCNVRCKHCYILYPGATDNEMDTEQVKTVLKKLSDGGVMFLLMSGGEVLTRPDFKEIYLYAKRLGMLITVYTNATLVNEDIIDFWKKYPPRKIEVTIYGHSEEIYEAVTNSKGSWKRFRRGVDLIVEAGLHLKLKSMILKTNFHETYEMKEWAESKTGQWYCDRDVNPKLDSSTDVLAERLDVDQYIELDKLIPNFKQSYLSEVVSTYAIQTNYVFRCGAGVRTAHVDPTGHLHPCMLWRKMPFNLLEKELTEWNSYLHDIRHMRQEDGETGCNSCTQRNSCSRCPSASILEMDSPTAPVPYFCGIAQERKRVYGLPKSLHIQAI